MKINFSPGNSRMFLKENPSLNEQSRVWFIGLFVECMGSHQYICMYIFIYIYINYICIYFSIYDILIYTYNHVYDIYVLYMFSYMHTDYIYCTIYIYDITAVLYTEYTLLPSMISGSWYCARVNIVQEVMLKSSLFWLKHMWRLGHKTWHLQAWKTPSTTLDSCPIGSM